MLNVPVVDGLIVRLVFFAIAAPVFGVVIAVSRFFGPATPVWATLSPSTVTVVLLARVSVCPAMASASMTTTFPPVGIASTFRVVTADWLIPAPSNNPAVPGPVPLSKVTPPVGVESAARLAQLNTGGPPAEASWLTPPPLPSR